MPKSIEIRPFQIALELIYIFRTLCASCIDPITRRWRVIRFARERNVLKVVLSCSTERPTYSRDLSDFNRAHLRLLLLLLRAGVLAKDQFTMLLISFALAGISACTVTLTRESLRCAVLSVIFPISTPREHSFRIFLSSTAGTFRGSFASFFSLVKRKR